MIDIILPCYRCHQTITDTIHSVRDQTNSDWHLIIIIDEHDPFLYEFVHELCEDIRSKTIIMLDKNYGVAHARNVGLNRSSADYIAFIDADDIWHPKRLEHQLKILDENKHISICGTDYERFTVKPNMPAEAISKVKYKVISCNLLRFYNPFCFSSLLIRRSIVVDIKMDDVAHEDYDFLIKICSQNDIGLCLIQEKLVSYRLSPNSLSGNVFQSALNSLRIRRKNYGIIFALVTIPLYVTAVLIKRYVRY